MKLTVPYYSQFVDITDPFWMLRACGACALKEVIEYHGIATPDLISLCEEAKEKGGYHMQNGWVHDYLVEKAKELGLTAYRKEELKSTEEIKSFLQDGNPIIVSVEKRVLEQTRFHIVVLTGYEEGQFFYHESESTDKERGKNRNCSEEVFKNYWRGKAIFISPKV